jgi:periplasmic divalent cation tolerance protein
MDGIVVLVTVPTLEAAQLVAEVLLKKRLAACVNTVGPVSSTFLWKGDIEKASEYLLLIKTRRDLFSELTSAVQSVHSYELPEILGLPIALGEEAYLSWIDAEVTCDGSDA